MMYFRFPFYDRLLRNSGFETEALFGNRSMGKR